MKKRNPKALRQSNKPPYQLDVILPVYNERDSIEKVLSEWENILSRYVRYRFIICEDGSNDGTKELLLKLVKIYPIVLNQRNKRRGYSRSVLDGIACSTASYILCIDSDGQCNPKDFPAFWENRKPGGVVIGWRKKRADVFQRKLFSLLFLAAFQALFPIKIHDPSAPFVLFQKNVILPYVHELTHLKEGFWWGFVAVCVKYRLSIHELPMVHRKRLSGATNVYHLKNIPRIAASNFWGLLRIRFN